jgi:hypothetical protein
MSAERCPSELELDAFVVAGRPAGDALQAHARTCERCQARLAARELSRERFLREVYPVTVAAVEAAGERARPGAGWLAWLLRPAALGVAAGLVLLVLGAWLWWRTPGAVQGPGDAPPDTYVGVKGGASLQVYARRGDRVFPVRPGERLRQGDRLRFAPLLPGPGFVMPLSADAAGRVRLFFPQSRRRAAALRPPLGAAALPGAIELDDSRGPERLWLLFSTQAFELDAVEAAVAEGLRTAGGIERLELLPLELDQVSLPVRKE